RSPCGPELFWETLGASQTLVAPVSLQLCSPWRHPHALASCAGEPLCGRRCLASRGLVLVVPALARRAALADAHGLDAVVVHGLDPDREVARADRVAPARQPPDLGEHEPADRVVFVAVDRQL